MRHHLVPQLFPSGKAEMDHQRRSSSTPARRIGADDRVEPRDGAPSTAHLPEYGN